MLSPLSTLSRPVCHSRWYVLATRRTLLQMNSTFQCFLDMIGFCEWSATCDAADAFALLDDLNSTFERLVTEYKLSKVLYHEMKSSELIRCPKIGPGRYCGQFFHGSLRNSTATRRPYICCFLFRTRFLQNCP